MSESQFVQFAAIISIALPDDAGHSEFNVLLGSADLVFDGDGNAKPLGDCTLAELQRFADDLEAEIWADYQSVSLFDLVVEGQASVSVVNSEAEAEDSASTELMLEQLVIFPIDDVDGNGDAVPEEIKSQKLREDLAKALESIPDPSEISEESALPVISVAKTEPVFEERSAQERDVDQIDERQGDDGQRDDLQRDVLQRDVEASLREELEVEERDDEHDEVQRVIEEPAEKVEPSAVTIRRLRRILGKRRPLNHRTWTAVDILINETAFRAAQVHAESSLDREVAGILIGPHPEKQPDGRYIVHVSDTIVAKHTRMKGASVTYTPESWRYVNDKLAELYPNEEAVIVGWYHTHPGFGIFLSGMDRFIHNNFFTQSWHIAMVLDPRARQSGFFCWDRGMSKVDDYEFPWPVWASGSW
jgi:proteasome lid subunit RPN8/RPN11